MKKSTRNILLILLGIILLIGIIILIIFAVGILQQTFPNQITYIGLKPNFPFDGNNINIHLEYTSAPDNWNLGWEDFTISWSDAITTDINGRTCTELGLYRDYAGEWGGGCGLNPILNDNNAIYKSATLDGQKIENVYLGRDGVTVGGFPTATAGKLIVDVKVEVKCKIGSEKCSGTHYLVCEEITQTFPSWFKQDPWDAIVNRYIDKGEVIGKCDVFKEIEVYRFENNKCTKLTIKETEKLSNDYTTKSECESKIIIEPEPCIENWNCGEFSSCLNNRQTRDCNDLNKCGTTISKPSLTQECNIEPPITPCEESWTYSSWSECKNGQQTRTATDENSCGTTIKRESLSRNCIIIEDNFWNQKTLGIKNLYLIIIMTSLVISFIIIFIVLIKIGRKK